MKVRSPRAMRYGAVLALSVASVFASSAVAMASPVAHAGASSSLVVQGTVTALTPTSGTPTSVTIQPQNLSRPSENILLTAGTVYMKSGVTVTDAALVVGVPVRITLTGSPANAATVQILTPEPVIIGGTVTALTPTSGTPTSVTVQLANSTKPTINVALGAGTLYYLGGATVTVTSLLVGSQVHITASGTPPTATTVEIAVPRPVEINGVVTALTPSSGTPTSVTVLPIDHHGVAVSVTLSANTVYRQGGATVTVTSLLVGSQVQIKASGTPSTATTVEIAVPRPVEINGVVTALAPASGTPTSVTVQPVGFSKTPVTVQLGTTMTYMQLKATVTVAALLVGSHVELTASGNPLTAAVVHIAAPATDVTIGSVTAVTSTSMTVQPKATGSTPVVFTLTNSTMYFSGRKVSTIVEVNVGDIVRVIAAASASTTALDVTVSNMVIVGRVTGVVGNVISVTGFYGATLTVNVTGTTNYLLSGKASTLTAVSIGDLISAIGPAMSGVTHSVTATTVWIGTKHNDIYHDALIQHRDADRRHHR